MSRTSWLLASTALTGLLALTACTTATTACTGGFDAEIAPGATGHETKVAAAEAWASTSDAPDTGWVETTAGATNEGWVLTITETDSGEWIVMSQRCA